MTTPITVAESALIEESRLWREVSQRLSEVAHVVEELRMPAHAETMLFDEFLADYDAIVTAFRGRCIEGVGQSARMAGALAGVARVFHAAEDGVWLQKDGSRTAGEDR